MTDTAQVNVSVAQAGPSASCGMARDHQVTMDRPEAKGGENRGPMGGETLLMALGGCFMSNLLAAGQTRETELNGARLDITGTISGTPARFTEIAMTVSADPMDRTMLEKLVTIAERGCIVANTLKHTLSLSIGLA